MKFINRHGLDHMHIFMTTFSHTTIVIQHVTLLVNDNHIECHFPLPCMRPYIRVDLSVDSNRCPPTRGQ